MEYPNPKTRREAQGKGEKDRGGLPFSAKHIRAQEARRDASAVKKKK